MPKYRVIVDKLSLDGEDHYRNSEIEMAEQRANSFIQKGYITPEEPKNRAVTTEPPKRPEPTQTEPVVPVTPPPVVKEDEKKHAKHEAPPQKPTKR